MLKRLINVIKSWFGFGLEKLENPEVLLEQAKQEMQEVHQKNRERAVQAITQKNNLQAMVDDLQKKVDTLQARAEMALKRGDREVALQMLKEKQSYEGSLASTRVALEKAVSVAEEVKEHIKREEEQIRQKTAETLRLKAEWKAAQIQNEIEKQLSGFREMEDTSSLFNRAKEKIQSTNAEAAARMELGKTSTASKMYELEKSEADLAAETALAQMEERLGIGHVAPTTQTATATTELEEELARLEAKVGGGGSTAS